MIRENSLAKKPLLPSVFLINHLKNPLKIFSNLCKKRMNQLVHRILN